MTSGLSPSRASNFSPPSTGGCGRVLTLQEAQQAETVFRHDLTYLYRVLPVGTVLLDLAMALVARHPLRAYDAVQLAGALYLRDRYLAQGLGAPVLVSADQALNQAARAERLQVEDPSRLP
jgi:uncharacterized protein